MIDGAKQRTMALRGVGHSIRQALFLVLCFVPGCADPYASHDDDDSGSHGECQIDDLLVISEPQDGETYDFEGGPEFKGVVRAVIDCDDSRTYDSAKITLNDSEQVSTWKPDADLGGMFVEVVFEWAAFGCGPSMATVEAVDVGGCTGSAESEFLVVCSSEDR